MIMEITNETHTPIDPLAVTYWIRQGRFSSPFVQLTRKDQNMLESFEKIIIDQRELIQNDLLTILDGLPQEVLDLVCQVIVDRFSIILDK